MRRALLALVLLAACANPVPPTGGPQDETPPVLVEAEPAEGAVNVEADAVELVFSEYVDPAAFGRALTLTPAFETPPEVSFRGRRATVTFPEPLRPNTTYILTVDTNLRDLRGVGLTEPLVIAFSTGPTISRGRIAGRVVGPERGEGVAGLDVYAYALADTAAAPPAPLPDAPPYRTQTGPDGAFAFDYLTEGPYYVVALGDRNRSRLPDLGEPFAVPPRPFVVADTVGAPVEAPWVAAVLDTVPPVPQRVRALSGTRLAVRFSEPVALAARDAAAWTLEDSLAGSTAAVRDVYTVPDAPQDVYVLTAPLAERPHRLRAGGVVDTSGNAVADAVVRFTPSAVPDTVRARFLRFGRPQRPAADGAEVLLPDAQPALLFSAPPSDSLLRAAVRAETLPEDSAGVPTPRAFAAVTEDGTTVRLRFEPPLGRDERVRVAVRRAVLGGPDSTATRTYTRIASRTLGGRAGVIAAPDATGVVVVEFYPAEAAPDAEPTPFVTVADSLGRYRFPALPAGTYRLRAFVDRDGDRAWDPGRLAPYAPAEPILWGADSLEVQARWEREDPDTLRFRPPAAP